VTTMMKVKFKIDDFVKDVSKEVAREFTCAVCLFFVTEPVVQLPCGHVYCKECLTPCSLCPQCRQPFEVSEVCLLRDVNRMGMRMMQGIQVHCPQGRINDDDDAERKKRRRRGIVCNWQGSYGDLMSRHLCECPSYPIKCPQDCGQVFPRGHLEFHQFSCEKAFKNCSICWERVPIKNVTAHNQEKALHHVDILVEKLKACEEAENHSISTRLAALEDQLKTRASTAHVLRFAEDIKAHITSQGALVHFADNCQSIVQDKLTNRFITLEEGNDLLNEMLADIGTYSTFEDQMEVWRKLVSRLEKISTANEKSSLR
jgi:hypothetical protein